jgi:hypothetical protein
MPSRGGTADKFGNRYEALWAIDQLLRIVDGEADILTLEPLDDVESRGIEFTVLDQGHKQYWSVKRQTSKAAGWTLALLTAEDETARTILGDLFSHIRDDPRNMGVFASTLAAGDLEELRACSKTSAMFDERLRQSEDLKGKFDKYILPLCSGNKEEACALLFRCDCRAVDETSLREQVSFAIRHLFYSTETNTVDPLMIRGALAELLLDNIHQPINRNDVLSFLGNRGIHLRDWSQDPSIRDRVEALCEEYVRPLSRELINARHLVLAGAETVISGTPTAIAPERTLVVGAAGGGKSITLSQAVTHLRNTSVPVLPLRFDQLPDGILSTTELGRKLGLPESPVLALAGIANGNAAVLVIDQLDTVSLASGRRPDLWELFDKLRREVDRLPGMSLLVGCREFDVEHDHRLRSLTGAGFRKVSLGHLSRDQVDEVLAACGTDPDNAAPSLKQILTTPLNLWMFLALPNDNRATVRGRDDLFNRFWIEGNRRTDRRLGRPSAYVHVIETLSEWLSVNQQLSAPRYVLDQYGPDADAMTSEQILVLSEDRFRFFHESFFDYAFARRFAVSGKSIVELLLSSEQHLFRRSQVRQILAFLRSHDFTRYLKELEATLTTKAVRFHIRRFVMQWLSSLPDPRPEEWLVLERSLSVDPLERAHLRWIVAGQAAWFDILDSIGFFDGALSSGDRTREEEVVWLFSLHQTLEHRSNRVAHFLRRYRRAGEPWTNYLRHVCRTGAIYHSREMFDLFLALIADGTLDGLRPGFAMNDDWWSVLYSVADDKAEWACEAIGYWFDRAVSTWRQQHSGAPSDEDQRARGDALRSCFDGAGRGVHVIFDAAKAPLAFAEQLLPRVTALIRKTQRHLPDGLSVDPLWSFRSYGDEVHFIHAALLIALAKALELLAVGLSNDLDRLLAPYVHDGSDSIAFLILRAWSAAPDRYANQIADYLISDPRRFTVGYDIWTGNGGSAQHHVSSQAVSVASSRSSPDRVSSLEAAIRSYKHVGANDPRSLGLEQLELLRAFDKSRLSSRGQQFLAELERRFPNLPNEPPTPFELIEIKSPIAESAQDKMSDDQWLKALEKYAGVEERASRRFALSGGEHELALALEGRTKADPARFAAIAHRIPDEFPASYYDALIMGLGDRAAHKTGKSTVSIDQVAAVIRRVHALPSKPCGRSIAFLIERWDGTIWPLDIVEIVSWYAVNDPDPNEEIWRKSSRGGSTYYRGDPYSAGINSTRGSIAGALATLLFDNPQIFRTIESAIYRLSHDPSIAVRSCAVRSLSAMLNIDVQKAVSWFNDCAAHVDPVILGTPHVARFLNYAGYRCYDEIRPVILKMLESGDDQVVEAGARLITVLSLTVETAVQDRQAIEIGSVHMRKGAVTVYAHNIAHSVVGQECRARLKVFFRDADDSVRTEAADAFDWLPNLSTDEQAELLSSVLDGSPSRDSFERIFHVLEQSPVHLPDLVCRLLARAVQELRSEASDLSRAATATARSMSRVVVRLYVQTTDAAIQSQCLTLIDEMERYQFFGLAEELHRLER